MGELCAGTQNYIYIFFFIINNFQTLEETIYICIENKKPPSYFKTLLETLKVLCDFFYGDLTPRDETLTRMKLLLQLYASDSAELIGRYHWNRSMQFHFTNVCSVVPILHMQCPSCCTPQDKGAARLASRRIQDGQHHHQGPATQGPPQGGGGRPATLTISCLLQGAERPAPEATGGSPRQPRGEDEAERPARGH